MASLQQVLSARHNIAPTIAGSSQRYLRVSSCSKRYYTLIHEMLTISITEALRCATVKNPNVQPHSDVAGYLCSAIFFAIKLACLLSSKMRLDLV